jgi:hypothetical protein
LTISGAQREVVEGFTALLAAVVLFSVSYWLISKIEAKKWHQYIQNKVQEALTGGRIAALVGVSFLAVYREAFETVLFYQALWLQSPSTQIFVIWGFLIGVAVLAAIIWSLFKVGMKIPLRLFFGISSALLYLLAFVFAGEGIKDLQATGWFRETPLPNLPQMPMLGIYPTLAGSGTDDSGAHRGSHMALERSAGTSKREASLKRQQHREPSKIQSDAKPYRCHARTPFTSVTGTPHFTSWLQISEIWETRSRNWLKDWNLNYRKTMIG